MVPAHPVTPWFYIGRRADDATTLISRPRALVVSRWIYYDLDEPEEAEAVLLEGCEHAEDFGQIFSQIFGMLHPFPGSFPPPNHGKCTTPFSSINL